MPSADNSIIDQMGRSVKIPAHSKRIVSLVPSQTELLVDLGLEDRLVGVTKFCVHPEYLRKKVAVIGGTKNLQLDKIRELQPDLIIGNKEENTRSDIEQLEKEFPVWMSDILTIADALDMVKLVGKITGTDKMAQELMRQISVSLNKMLGVGQGKRTAYLIWKNPWMAAGNDTFIHSLLEHAGFVNVFSAKTRYPEFDLKTLQALNPELILLSSEPFPFSEKHIGEISGEIPNAEIRLVDGEMFSWYGSRLAKTGDYLQKLFT